MDYHRFKSAVNRYLARHIGGDSRPVYYDIDQYCPALHHLEAAYPAIRTEVETLLSEHLDMPEYHVVNPPAKEISSTTAGRWNVFMLELLGYKLEDNLARCPETARVLERIPGKVQAFFSILEPGKSVPRHEGPYLGYLRYHLGIKVPRENPPSIVVADQPYVWKEGEGVLFDDFWPHEVINHSSEPRVVLIVDIYRPLPVLPNLVNHALLRTIAAPTYGKSVIRKAKAYAVH
ncbi:aspartyl/asparaginyl beta-hydroxylase domain-containing protein [Mangrovitalea sediminis]|uniref:aspartyl/asparaginyl beta-hydroxylase domain-containing protein n=1 Tax=Mangrovitalea sediminis TaxID=1982043 RepID=UPI0018E91AD6|nr:aspartyl/asparaginyl beta-hydroxylase domain-containing protein [Mangrovitalea sediminis]